MKVDVQTQETLFLHPTKCKTTAVSNKFLVGFKIEFVFLHYRFVQNLTKFLYKQTFPVKYTNFMENGSFFCQYSLAITICRENASLYYRATSLYMTTKIVWPSRTTAGVLREKKRGKTLLEIIIAVIKLHNIIFKQTFEI